MAEKWNQEYIKQKVYSAVADAAGAEEADLSDETELLTTLNMDSLAVFELAIELEESFELQIPDEDIDKIRTVGEAVSYIEIAVKEKNANNTR
ncbi:MAG: acyl carrier protein [Clostridiales bacterium]|nr:acyl carrier protein [Clostridiales bacterium]